MKVSAYHGDAICSAMRLLIRSSERQEAEKQSSFGILVMGRDEKREGG